MITVVCRPPPSHFAMRAPAFTVAGFWIMFFYILMVLFKQGVTLAAPGHGYDVDPQFKTGISLLSIGGVTYSDHRGLHRPDSSVAPESGRRRRVRCSRGAVCRMRTHVLLRAPPITWWRRLHRCRFSSCMLISASAALLWEALFWAWRSPFSPRQFGRGCVRRTGGLDRGSRRCFTCRAVLISMISFIIEKRVRWFVIIALWLSWRMCRERVFFRVT